MVAACISGFWVSWAQEETRAAHVSCSRAVSYIISRMSTLLWLISVINPRIPFETRSETGPLRAAGMLSCTQSSWSRIMQKLHITICDRVCELWLASYCFLCKPADTSMYCPCWCRTLSFSTINACEHNTWVLSKCCSGGGKLSFLINMHTCCVC